MDLFPMQSTLPLVALAVLLVVAVRWDVLHHRIPNSATGLGFAMGCLLGAVASGFPGLYRSLGGAVVGLLCLLPFHLLRGMGAGDVKLMAAVGAFLGPLTTAFAAALTLVAGALIALGIVFRTRVHMASPVHALLAEVGEAPGMQPKQTVWKTRFPYAIAVATGTLAAVLLRAIGFARGFG
jgi:prepilin peptidase CpaA